jgi:hypothetical protein
MPGCDPLAAMVLSDVLVGWGKKLKNSAFSLSYSSGLAEKWHDQFSFTLPRYLAARGALPAPVAAGVSGEALCEMGGGIDRHARLTIFQLAEVAVSREMFSLILDRINRLRPVPI